MSVMSLIDEEAAAFDVPLANKIHTAALLSEDMKQRDAEIAKIASEYEDAFKTKEDAEYFAMLPLSRSDRVRVLDRARALGIGNGDRAKKYIYKK
jgi:hypothetical protein